MKDFIKNVKKVPGPKLTNRRDNINIACCNGYCNNYFGRNKYKCINRR